MSKWGSKIEQAANFTSKMMREGTYMGKALKIACSYYGVAYADVQRELASRSGKSRQGRKAVPKPRILCECCGLQEAIWKLTARRGYEKLSSQFFCAQRRDQNPNGFQSSQEREITRKWVAYKSTEQEAANDIKR